MPSLFTVIWEFDLSLSDVPPTHTKFKRNGRMLKTYCLVAIF